MYIKCVDGPLRGKNVDVILGPLWPYVLHYEYGKHEILIGYYRLADDGERLYYYWANKTELVSLKSGRSSDG